MLPTPEGQLRHPGANRLYLRPHSRATTCETTCIWCLDPMSSHECINGHPPANVLASIRPQGGAKRGAGAKGRWPNSAPARKRPTSHSPRKATQTKISGATVTSQEGSTRAPRTASPGPPEDLVSMSKHTGVSYTTPNRLYLLWELHLHSLSHQQGPHRVISNNSCDNLQSPISLARR